MSYLPRTPSPAEVTLMEGVEPTEELRAELRGMPRNKIGPFAGPDTIQWAPGLPKTRSGKIMRRILRKVAAAPAACQWVRESICDRVTGLHM